MDDARPEKEPLDIRSVPNYTTFDIDKSDMHSWLQYPIVHGMRAIDPVK